MSDIKNQNNLVSDFTDKQRPFFSVIIPTMNRPEFLKATLKSALWQTFKNYEIIISDNSNSDEMRQKNQETIKQYSDQKNLRYIRPDKWLNMPAHFEFATPEAKGKYVLIFTDRRVMMPHALEYLHSQILTMAPEIGLVCWYDHWNFSSLSGLVTGGPFFGESKILNSQELARDFANFEQWKEGGYWSYKLPHTLNGCFRLELATEVRKICGKLFVPVSPDFMGGFLMLAHTPEVLYIDRPLYLQHSGNFVGNGTTSFLDGNEKFTNTFPEVDPHEGTPIRINTLFNTLARDFLKAKEMVRDKYSDIQPNWVGYYVSNYLEIMDKEKMGSGMNLVNLYALWEEGLSRLPEDQQVQVRKILKGFQDKRASFIALRKWVRKVGLAPYYSWVVGKIRNIKQRLSGQPVYASVFEAAIKTDYLQPGPLPSFGKLKAQSNGIN